MNLVVLRLIVLMISILKFQCREISLWKSIGLMEMKLDDDDLTIVNGFSIVNMQLDLNYPEVDPDSKDACTAMVDSDFAINVNKAQLTFNLELQQELGAFFDLVPRNVPEKPLYPLTESNFTIKELKNNIFLCGHQDVKCVFNPVWVKRDNNRNMDLQPCYDSTLGTDTHCHRFLENSICCSKKQELNNEKCPVKLIEHARQTIAAFEKNHPRQEYHLSHAIKTIDSLNNFCLAITEYDYQGERVYRGRMIIETSELKETQADVFDMRRKKRSIMTDEKSTRSRKRRSNWSYWLSLGPLSSHYIDSNIAKLQDLEKHDVESLAHELKKDKQTILQLSADGHELNELKSNICKFNTGVSVREILNEIRQTYGKLEQKAESILVQCESGKVPIQVETAHLKKICQSLSGATICYGHFVRELFSCELLKPILSESSVKILFQLKMAHPVNESFQSSLLFTLPMTIPGRTFNREYNISDKNQKNTMNSKTPIQEELLKHAFEPLMKKATTVEISRTHCSLKTKILFD